jgi:hypothetical protein
MHYIVDVKDQQDILCPISCWNRVGFCNHTWFVREIYASVFVDSNKVLVPPLKNTSLQAIKLAQSTNFWETQIIKGCRPCRRPRKNRQLSKPRVTEIFFSASHFQAPPCLYVYFHKVYLILFNIFECNIFDKIFWYSKNTYPPNPFTLLSSSLTTSTRVWVLSSWIMK